MAISAPQVGRCATFDVDLEALAVGYGHRPPSAAALEHALRAIAGLAPRAVALDVGGGPGHHAATWAESGLTAVVVDPSERMVHLAAQHQGVSAVRGLSQALPFREGSVSLVYFHLSIHYGDWRLSLREARRVLASGGRCVVWTLGPEHHRRSMLARWFPSVAAIDTERFPFPAAVVDELAAIGFSVDKGFEVEEVRKPAADWSSAVEAGFVSTLQLISADEKQAGLRAFGASYPDPAQPVSYEMRWDRIVGTTSAD